MSNVDMEGAEALLFCVFLLFLTVLVAFLIEKYHIMWLSDGAAACIIGLIGGGFLRLAGKSVGFETGFFFNVLLPPIIFFAGFSLKRRNFFRNLSTILVLSYLGTIISTLIIGLFSYGLGKWGFVDINAFEALLFGALISAIDPVATLSVFEKLQAPPMLHNLVFGESVLNDAVSIVIFSSVLQVAESDSAFSAAAAFKAIGIFAGVSLGSTCIGCVTALIGAFLLKHLKIGNSKLELTLLVLIAYMSYLIAEIAHTSGIMSMFFCGILSAHYSYHNMCPDAATATQNFFGTLAYLSEMFVFAFLGLATFSVDFPWHPGFIALSLLICLAARAFNTFPLLTIANRRRKSPVPKRFQLVIWFAGIRGAIAVALAFSIPEDKDKYPDRGIVVTTTLFIVLFTTLVIGGLTFPFMKLLGITTGTNESDLTTVLNNEQPAAKPRTGLHGAWKKFDTGVMKPVFGGHIKENDVDVTSSGLPPAERVSSAAAL